MQDVAVRISSVRIPHPRCPSTEVKSWLWEELLRSLMRPVWYSRELQMRPMRVHLVLIDMLDRVVLKQVLKAVKSRSTEHVWPYIFPWQLRKLCHNCSVVDLIQLLLDDDFKTILGITLKTNPPELMLISKKVCPCDKEEDTHPCLL